MRISVAKRVGVSRRVALPIVALGLLVASAHTGAAAESAFNPACQDIATCSPDRSCVVDRGKLATYVLRRWKASPPLSLGVLPQGESGKTKSYSDLDILLDDLRPGPKPGSLCPNASCTADDTANLASVYGTIARWLAGNQQNFKPQHLSADADVASYLASRVDGDLECSVDDTNVATVGSFNQSTALSALDEVRLRGQPDDLYVDRGDKNFAAASRATLDFTDDEKAGKRTDKLTAALGYHFGTSLEQDKPNQYVNVIPYVATNRNIVTVHPGSKAKASASDIVQVGTQSNAFMYYDWPIYQPIGHLFTARPDYLLNLQDDSRLFTMNIRYLPVMNGVALNTFRRIAPTEAAAAWDIYGKCIIDLRTDIGVYTDRGSASVEAAHDDFVRLGGQAGAAMVADGLVWMPELKATYNGLYAANGHRNVGSLNTSATWSLYKNFVGLTVMYSDGFREDTIKREQLVQVAFSLRY